MREKVEFRIPESKAVIHLAPGVGIRIGESVRIVRAEKDSPLYAEIGQLQRDYRARGEFFFLGRTLKRTYSPAELRAAEIFTISSWRKFEPTGEECGTEYDESTSCPECGAGARQTSELVLDFRRIPKRVDFAMTIGGERIVSQRAAECLMKSRLVGFELCKIKNKTRYIEDAVDYRELETGRKILRQAEAAGVPYPTWEFFVWLNRDENRQNVKAVMSEFASMKRKGQGQQTFQQSSWYQLCITSPSFEMIPPTKFGDDPFDTECHGKCPLGDTVGLGTLSEVTVKRDAWNRGGFVETKQFVGVRRGLLRPRPVVLISAEARRTIIEARLTGLTFEVAYLR